MSPTSGPRVCSIDAALKVVGDKWSLLVLRELTMGCTRYAEIVHNTGVSRDILTRRLRRLERAGIVSRHLYHERPPRYDYRLAAAGEQLYGLLLLLRHWGDTWASGSGNGLHAPRHSCGAALTPELRCAHCGELLRADSLMQRSERDLKVEATCVDDTAAVERNIMTGSRPPTCRSLTADQTDPGSPGSTDAPDVDPEHTRTRNAAFGS